MRFEGLEEDGPAESPAIVGSENGDEGVAEPLPAQTGYAGADEGPVEAAGCELAADEPDQCREGENACRTPFPPMLTNSGLRPPGSQRPGKPAGEPEKLNLS